MGRPPNHPYFFVGFSLVKPSSYKGLASGKRGTSALIMGKSTINGPCSIVFLCSPEGILPHKIVGVYWKSREKMDDFIPLDFPAPGAP